MSTDEQLSPAPAQDVPGQVLKARREAMGWSVEQIADQLKLAPRQVVALEAGDYESLPPAAVVRGFVRGYAKVVKVDATPLVAAIPVDAAAAAADASAGMRREQRVTSMPKVRYPSHGKRSRFPVGPVVFAALVLGSLAAAWQFGLIPLGEDAPAASSSELAAPALPGADGTVTEPVAAPALPANGVAAPETAPAGTLQSPAVPLISVPPVQPSTDPNAPAAPASAAPAEAAPAVQPAVVTPAPAAAPTPAPVKPAGSGALVLDVKQDSWIEVRGASGALVSRLVKAGSTETVDINGPVTLVVGNPKGVDATLRGAPLALPQLKNSTVSRQKIQ